MKNTLIITALIAILLACSPKETNVNNEKNDNQVNTSVTEEIKEKNDQEEKEYNEKITHKVPFTSQAPFGEWEDGRQQDGCEEASSLMAILWAQDTKSISKEEAKQEILNIAKYLEQNYGYSKDTNAKDTVERIIKGYFNYQNAEVKEISSTDAIKEALYSGKLVIIPAQGQKLGNKYFSGAGPEKHMLVIKGYNPSKNEFITNDPGTRRGEDYAYAETVIWTAINDYPSSGQTANDENPKKIIVVSK